MQKVLLTADQQWLFLKICIYGDQYLVCQKYFYIRISLAYLSNNRL